MQASQKQTRMGDRSLQNAAELLRVIAHPVRIRLMQTIIQRVSTVGELAKSCEVAGPVVSGHLRMLQQHGLLARERDGRRAYYRAIEPSLPCILKWIANQFEKPATIDDVCCHHNPGQEVIP